MPPTKSDALPMPRKAWVTVDRATGKMTEVYFYRGDARSQALDSERIVPVMLLPIPRKTYRREP